MGASQSQYRPHTINHPYLTPTWGPTTTQNGHYHHPPRAIRPAFGFGGPPPHLRKR